MRQSRKTRRLNRGRALAGSKRRFSWFFRTTGVQLPKLFKFVSLKLGSSLFVWLLVGIALALPAALRLAQQNFVALDDGWQGRPGLTVYFTVGTEYDNVPRCKHSCSKTSSMIEGSSPMQSKRCKNLWPPAQILRALQRPWCACRKILCLQRSR